MTKPTDTFDPRPGEIVLCCKHKMGENSEWFYIEFDGPVGDTREDHGLGNLMRGSKGDKFYARYVLLCWWCCFVCWVRRLEPISRARRKVAWVAE